MRVLAALVLCAACGDDGGATTSDAATGADATGDGGGSSAWRTGTAVARGAIQETAAVAVAGKIYVIGGFLSGEGITPRVLVYDTATSTWGDAPDLPAAIHHANAATDGTTIYVVGALVTNSFTAVGSVYSYNPGTDIAWQPHTSMTAGRERGAAVTDVIDGKVYVAGGFRGGAASSLVDVYDPVQDDWTALQDLPAARDHACGGALGGELVLVGGRTAAITSPQATVWSFAPGANAWTPRAAMPTGRAGMGCGVIDGVLYTTGGEGAATSTGVFDDVEAYSLATDTWTPLPVMPNPKHGVGGAAWDGALYLCGGADQAGFGAIADTDVFTP